MKEKIKGGAIILAREIIENEIFLSKPDKWFKIFFYIICRANFKDKEQFKRGECFLKYPWIKEATGATKDQVYACIKWLKKTNIITTQKTTRGIRVDVLNYDKYQSFNSYKCGTKDDVKTTRERQVADTILKNDNNIKESKNDNLQAKPAPEENPDEKNNSELPSARITNQPDNLQKTNNPVPAEQIVEIITLFKNTNPALKYDNLTERKAVVDLISDSDFQEIKDLAEYAIKVREEQYAPKVFTPHELWLRQAKLKSYKNKITNKLTYKPYANSNPSENKYRNAT